MSRLRKLFQRFFEAVGDSGETGGLAESVGDMRPLGEAVKDFFGERRGGGAIKAGRANTLDDTRSEDFWISVVLSDGS